eukprot:2131353-Pleurochrysis_carterae.AAC.1
MTSQTKANMKLKVLRNNVTLQSQRLHLDRCPGFHPSLDLIRRAPAHSLQSCRQSLHCSTEIAHPLRGIRLASGLKQPFFVLDAKELVSLPTPMAASAGGSCCAAETAPGLI